MNNNDFHNDRNVFRCLQSFLPTQKPQMSQKLLEISCKDSIDFVQRLGKLQVFTDVHKRCVNCVEWNADGTVILSGSDDKGVAITDPFAGRMLQKITTEHRGNIFSARFLPYSNSEEVLSCCSEGMVAYTNFKHGTKSILRPHHGGEPVYDILPVPDASRCAFSCGEDAIRMYDLRSNNDNGGAAYDDSKAYIETPKTATSFDISSFEPNILVVGCADSVVRIYDRRFLKVDDASNKYTTPLKCFPYPVANERAYKITSVRCSADNASLLVNYVGDSIYIYDIRQQGFSETELKTTDYFTRQKPMYDNGYVIRLCGDWSDTGPEALNEGYYATTMRAPWLSLGRLLRQFRENRTNATAAERQPVQNDWQRLSQAALNMNRTTSTSNEPAGETTVTQGSSGNIENIEALEQLHTLADLNDLLNKYVVMKYTGHRNIRTIIKNAIFWGNKFVMSGSECGHIFIWERETGRLVKTLQGDKHVVNHLAAHPSLPYLASSGIDYDFKIWAPIEPAPIFDEAAAAVLLDRNSRLLARAAGVITMNPIRVLRNLQLNMRQRNLTDAAN